MQGLAIPPHWSLLNPTVGPGGLAAWEGVLGVLSALLGFQNTAGLLVLTLSLAAAG